MNDGKPSAESALLLLCAASDGSAKSAEAIEQSAASVSDWRMFFELSSRHAIVPVVEQELRRSAPAAVPPDVVAKLRDETQKAAMQSLMLSSELVKVARAFSERAIDALPFKGPTLASLVYGSLALRQYQDLDVLVHLEDLDDARDVLLSLGFVPVLPLSKARRASLVLSGHHEQFVNSSSAAHVELHWSLNNRALSRDSLEPQWWENRQPVALGGVTMRTLGVEQLLLYLCMHGGKHSWARLGWLCDLEFALRAYPEADWSSVWSLARENGAERMVGIGLSLVEELFGGYGLVAPARKIRGADPKADDISIVLAARIRGDQIFDPYLDYRVQVRSRERLRDRFRYTWHILAAPHPADIALLGLPRALHWVYYLLRPIRLVLKNAAKGFRPARAS